RKSGGPIKEPGVTVKIIRTGARNNVNNCAGISPKFRLEVRRQQAKLLYGVGPRLTADGTANGNLIVVTAVERDVIFNTSAAVNTDAQAVTEPTGCRCNTGLDQRQIENLSAIQRQTHDSSVIHGRSEGRRFLVDQLDSGGHRNLSTRPAHHQSHVGGHVSVWFNRYIRDRRVAKSRGSNDHVICRGFDLEELICTVV